MIALIPARGGSRRVPRKNLRRVGGKPLIAWTIEAARDARAVDRVIVTTDDPEIADVARDHGAEIPFLRPPILATDTATSADVVTHALRALHMAELADSSFALLQPTSPLRTASDIDAAADMLAAGDAVVSVTPMAHSVRWLRTIDSDGFLHPWLAADVRDLTLYQLNGAIYMMRTDRFLRDGELIPSMARAYVMPQERSVDIDTEFDLNLCDLILNEHEASV
jgi:CMP-N,N'-diacetyllegionaminic acid synthase